MIWLRSKRRSERDDTRIFVDEVWQIKRDIYSWTSVKGEVPTWKQLHENAENWERIRASELLRRKLSRQKQFAMYISRRSPVVGPSPPKSVSRLERCRSMVGLAKHFLPRDQRDDFADECLDEVEAAAEAGRPVIRRTASILFRALPVLIVRSRLPARARKAGAKGE